jgi:hypothetical protein
MDVDGNRAVFLIQLKRVGLALEKIIDELFE